MTRGQTLRMKPKERKADLLHHTAQLLVEATEPFTMEAVAAGRG